MKKIGSGWTFDVYEYGNQKVLKKKKRPILRMIKILRGDPRLIFTLNKTIYDLDNLNRRSVKIIENLRNTTFDFQTLANPESISEKGYIQNKCLPVGNFLKDDRKVEEIIEKYIEQIKYFWRYGFADMVFNFTLNNGLDKNQNIVLFDFNEVTSQKERVLTDIENQKWLKKHSFRFDLNKKQKIFFKKRMREELTHETLKALWCKNKTPTN